MVHVVRSKEFTNTDLEFAFSSFLVSPVYLWVHASCPQIYALSAAFLLPDVIFYTKLVVELVDWGAERPAWAKTDWSCGLWQVKVIA